MYLHQISLENYRSFYQKTAFQFHPKFTLITGPNSVGKTNLLESIYFSSLGQGFREKQLKDLVAQNQEWATVESITQDKGEPQKYAIRLTGSSSLVSKSFYINSLNKTGKQYQQRIFKVVLFEPDDILIINTNASTRRTYFDQVIRPLDYQYYLAKNGYSRGLYKRNKILENQHHYSSISLKETLVFWDKYLEKQAQYLQAARQDILDFYNHNPQLNGMSFKIDYQINKFVNSSDSIQLQRELKLRRTLSGPQLDEFVFYLQSPKDSKNLLEYGSRSEQRLCVLWLKLNELKFIQEKSQEAPILLMDDIFSELDKKNSQRILSIALNYQTIITTANLDILSLLPAKHLKYKQITLGP